MALFETLAYSIIAIGITMTLFLFIFFELQYKHNVIIKEIVSGRKIVRKYKAKDYIDKDGVKWWRLAKEKIKSRKLMPLPPEQAIEIDQKGKKWVECYRTEGDELIFLKDTSKMETFPEELIAKIPDEIKKITDPAERKEEEEKWKKKVKEDWMKEHNVVEPYQPLTTKQRLIYVNNIRKAESRKAFSWQQQLVPLASIGLVCIIVISLIVFWGEIAAPAITANSQAVEISKNQLEMTKLLREIKTGQQYIGDQPSPEIPPPPGG